MPTERLSMRRIRDVLRLKYEARLSERAMVAALGISKGAIGSYLNRARAAGLSWPLPEGLTDTELERRLSGTIMRGGEKPSIRKLPGFDKVPEFAF